MNLLTKNKSLIKILLSNGIIIFSGYHLWYILAESSIVHVSFKAPVHVYNMKESDCISAPSMIDITVKCKRSAITSYLVGSCAIHIDRKGLDYGNNTSIITQSDIVLSPGLTLVEYSPQTILITLSKKQDLI